MTDIFRPGVAAFQQTNLYQLSLDMAKAARKCHREKCCLPECAHDCPTVAASVNLELVGICVLKWHTVPQPKHIRGVLFLSPCTL